LEEIRKQTVYQDYKFITFNELEELDLSDLIGSDLLRPHMHGMTQFSFNFPKDSL
jgi:ribosome biogenesis protein ENP2